MSSPEASSGEILRIIDANLNRIGEGLRLLEDIARFVLNDAALTGQLKTLRHSLLEGNIDLNRQFLQYRDSENDVGINLGQPSSRELPLVAVANARRVQESLRVIEELGKVPGIIARLDSEKFKQARFNLYSIERVLISKLFRQDKAGRIGGVYFILDADVAGGRSPVELAELAIRGGARVVHFSGNKISKAEFFSEALRLIEVCQQSNILFIINSQIEITLATGADGLCLGPDGLPVSVARKLLPVDKLLGLRINTVEEAVSAQSYGVDYLVFESPDLETFSKIRRTVSLPAVARRTIKSNNISDVLAAGAGSLAIGIENIGGDIEQDVREIAMQFEN